MTSLDGGGCTINFAVPLGGPTLAPIYVNNNHFGPHRAFTGCVALISNKTVMTEYNGKGGTTRVSQYRAGSSTTRLCAGLRSRW